MGDEDVRGHGSHMRILAPCLVAVICVIAFGLMVPSASAGRPSEGASQCIAHPTNSVPGVFESYYVGGCSGHDEPELDPISNSPGSARDLTWTVILPADGTAPVSAVGPTFWFGGTVNDSHSLFGQAFVELQFYPDAIVTGCTPHGGFILRQVANDYSVCSPVWKLTQTGHKGVFHETAAFNTMLTNSSQTTEPLVMHAGDAITVHWYVTPAADGFHVTVHDVSRGTSGTIVLDSPQDGPLMPAYTTQTVGHSLAWGVVNDAPNSFVWEIGHASDFGSPKGEFCLPGQSECPSYNAASWAATIPLTIVSVTFGDGSSATHWAVVSDFGGKAEIAASCPTYGGPWCIYPWFTLGSTGLHYGVDFPGTLHDFGKANQFRQQPTCGGPFGANSTYCMTHVL